MDGQRRKEDCMACPLVFYDFVCLVFKHALGIYREEQKGLVEVESR